MNSKGAARQCFRHSYHHSQHNSQSLQPNNKKQNCAISNIKNVSNICCGHCSCECQGRAIWPLSGIETNRSCLLKTHTLQEVFTVLSFQSNQSVSILVGYEEADALVHWRYPKTICMMVTYNGSATMFKNAGSSSELNLNTWFWATLNFGGYLGSLFILVV